MQNKSGVDIFKTGGGIVLTDGQTPAKGGFSTYWEHALKKEFVIDYKDVSCLRVCFHDALRMY
jgi:hypothetical protein